MEYAKLQYSQKDVNTAGQNLAKSPTTNTDIKSLRVIDNWRAVHAFPLNTFKVYLRKKAGNVYHRALDAQRIKRLSSIREKLQRMHNLRLWAMQDIGGCRAVVDSVSQVDALVNIYKRSDIKHKLIDEDDYIRTPRKSGYRSHHLIYSYYSDKTTYYNGRKVEIQLRSRLQHSWATAVETVGTFTSQALKSSQGEKDWLRFFQLMGTVNAFKEDTAPVPNTPTVYSELISELRHYAEKLQVDDKLSMYGLALKTLAEPQQGKPHFYLLVLDPSQHTIRIQSYKTSQLDQAFIDYTNREQSIQYKPGGEAVLVSVDSFKSLRKVYPNYFLDTARFLTELRSALSKKT